MKIIFLDIDGVLNSVMYENSDIFNEDNPYTLIDISRVKLLSDIVKATGAEIVLSSTWREDWDKKPELCGFDGEYLNRCLAKYGLSIMDKTPVLSYSDDRRIEILALLLERQAEVESFVVIDNINGGWGELFEQVVITNPYRYGLEEKHAIKAIELLKQRVQIIF